MAAGPYRQGPTVGAVLGAVGRGFLAVAFSWMPEVPAVLGKAWECAWGAWLWGVWLWGVCVSFLRGLVCLP